MEKKFVDKDIRIFHGEAAVERMVSNNDRDFLSDDGVVKVALDRWNTAQAYERKTWMEEALRASDDHNHENRRVFDRYKKLRSYPIRTALELGCGPFTNMRLIVGDVPGIEEITLVDPLLNDYLNHPHCAYKDGTLCGRSATLISDAAENAAFKEDDVFDLVVMINVLDHCYNVRDIFRIINRVTHRDSVLVVSEMVYTPESVKEIVSDTYNAGHPIRMTEEFFNNQLKGWSVRFSNDVPKPIIKAVQKNLILVKN